MGGRDLPLSIIVTPAGHSRPLGEGSEIITQHFQPEKRLIPGNRNAVNIKKLSITGRTIDDRGSGGGRGGEGDGFGVHFRLHSQEGCSFLTLI